MSPAFRYFELVDDESGRYEFWEVAITGPTLELRHGPVGTAGKYERETCASEALARNEYQIRIDAHLADGFRECADRRLDARIRDLEAAIEEDPDDVSSYLVYADWIQTLGDARGGLIVAQHAAETGDRAAMERAAAYLERYKDVFLGPLAEHIGYDGAPLEPTWRYGFIQGAKLVVRDLVGVSHAAVAEAFLNHPSARWLRELAVLTADHTGDLRPVVDVIANHVCSHVRSLKIGEVGVRRDWEMDDEFDDPDLYWERPPVSLLRLWRAVPNLRRLVIHGDPKNLGTIELPELTVLELRFRRLESWDLRSIADIHAPLERLELRHRWSEDTGLAETLRPIFDSSMIRGLDHLAIAGDRYAQLVGMDGVCHALARVPKLSLRSLDLSQGQMSDAGAEELATARLELEILDVSRNRLSYRGVAALRRIAKLVINDP